MIIIRNETVAFFLDQVRPNNISEFVGHDAYFTKHGWFYPISYYANDILDVLDGFIKKPPKQSSIQKAVLITHDGLLYEFAINKAGELRRRRVLYTPAIIYHRCDEPKEDQMISTYIDVAPQMSNEEMLLKVILDTENIQRKVMSMPFHDIVAELHKRFPVDVEKK